MVLHRTWVRHNLDMPTHLPDAQAMDRLLGVFAAQEQSLAASLAIARAAFDHPTNKGDAFEAAVRTFLSAHLPRKYATGHGEAIDRHGSRSSQLDIVVANTDHPIVYDIETAGLYLAEGVSAVGEAKAQMNPDKLEDILDKGRRLRQLKPLLMGDDVVHAGEEDRGRFVESIPYFALVAESTMAGKTILKTLQEAPGPDPENRGQVLPTSLDALFVLNRGVFIHYGRGRGALNYTMPGGEKRGGWLWQSTDHVLASLFIWLNASMPTVERHTPIGQLYLTSVEES